MNRETANTILDVCIIKFVEAGFLKFRKHDIEWPLCDGFAGWVGLNQGLHADFLRINPFLGIHCKPVMKLAANLKCKKYDRGVATIALHMGEICPDEDQVIFEDGDPIEPEAERLVNLYVKYAIPFYEKHTTFESLIPFLEEEAPRLGGKPELLVCTYYLMGDINKARQLTAEFLEKEPDYFSNFAENFLTFVNNKHGEKRNGH